jgi:hypothetical protein
MVPQGDEITGKFSLDLRGKGGIFKAGKIYLFRHEGTDDGKNDIPDGGGQFLLAMYQVTQHGKGMKFCHQKTPGSHYLGGNAEKPERGGKGTEGLYKFFLVPDFSQEELTFPHRGVL